MSRSYRISVKESASRVIKAEDGVCTDLEIVEVLPPEQRAARPGAQLQEHGSEQEGDNLARDEGDGVKTVVDPRTGTVTVLAEASEAAKVEGERSGRAYDDVGPHAGQVREGLRKELQKELEKKIEEKTGALQSKVTDKLEGKLSDLREELDQVVNSVTAEALKQKARQMGQIKEITEDPQAGSLTIVVEV